MTRDEIVNWLNEHIPWAVKPSRRAKTKLIYPFASLHAERQVVQCLAEEIEKALMLSGGNMEEEIIPKRDCEKCKYNLHHSPASAEAVINGGDE